LPTRLTEELAFFCASQCVTCRGNTHLVHVLVELVHSLGAGGVDIAAGLVELGGGVGAELRDLGVDLVGLALEVLAEGGER
jgi:hypothetical protein